MKPDEQKGLMNLVGQNAMGIGPLLTPSAQNPHYSLKRLPTRDPVTFAEQSQANLMQYADQLPRSMWHELVNQQSSVSKADMSNAVQRKALADAMQSAEPTFAIMKIHATDRANDVA